MISGQSPRGGAHPDSETWQLLSRSFAGRCLHAEVLCCLAARLKKNNLPWLAAAED
jgi:hypothetical protein